MRRRSKSDSSGRLLDLVDRGLDLSIQIGLAQDALGQSLAHLLLDALFQLRSENIRRRHQFVRLEHGRVQLVRPPPRGRPITRKNLKPAHNDHPHQPPIDTCLQRPATPTNPGHNPLSAKPDQIALRIS